MSDNNTITTAAVSIVPPNVGMMKAAVTPSHNGQLPIALPNAPWITGENDCFDHAIEIIHEWLNQQGSRWPTLWELQKKKELNQALKYAVMWYAIKIQIANNMKGTAINVKSIPRLSDYAAAQMILETGDVAVTQSDEDGSRVLMFYHHKIEATSDLAGTWSNNKSRDVNRIRGIASKLGVISGSLDNVAKIVKDHAPVIEEDEYGDVCLFSNGVLDLESFELTPYTLVNGEENPDYVSKYGDRHFFSKNAVAWDKDAKNEVIVNKDDGSEWSLDQHFIDTFGDNDDGRIKTETFLYAANFALRGIHPGKILLLTDGTDEQIGGGGKSTLIEALVRALGKDNVLKKNLPELAKGKFGGAHIVGKRLVAGYDCTAQAITNSGFIKTFGDGEASTYENKYQDPLEYAFKGMAIQAMQGILKTEVSDNAYWERFLMIPFYSRFRGTKERKYIKQDYIGRPAVMSYLAKKALMLGPVKQFPPHILAATERYKIEAKHANLPFYQFLDRFMPTLRNYELPFAFLMACYKCYCIQEGYSVNMTKGPQQAKVDFMGWCNEHPDSCWRYVGQNRNFSSNAVEEPALKVYKPEKWANDVDPAKWGNDVKCKTYSSWLVRFDSITGKEAKDIKNTVYTENDLKTMYREYVGAWYVSNYDRLIDGRMNKEDVMSFGDWKKQGGLSPRYVDVSENSVKEGFTVNEFVLISDAPL